MVREKKSTRLRRIFEGPGTTPVVLGGTPVHAVLAERAGFQAFHLSGAFASFWNLAIADVGIMTRSEMTQLAARIADSVDIPVFADADEGYGNAVAVWRTVHEYIRAGVGGMHIEDQATPKKAGNAAGRKLVSDEEMIGKLRAACAVRDELDPDFVIAVRTDGRDAEGGSLDEAIRRARLYRKETGVDVIYYELLDGWEECEIALKAVEGPAFCTINPLKRQFPPLAVQAAAGQKISVLSQPFLRGLDHAWGELNTLLSGAEDGIDDRQRHDVPGRMNMNDALAIDYADIRRVEELYLPENQRRDYASTTGV